MFPNTIDLTELTTVVSQLSQHAAPLASQTAEAARQVAHFCVKAWPGTREHLHFCLNGGVGLGFLMLSWHEWRHGTKHSAREKGVAGLVHWILAVFGP